MKVTTEKLNEEVSKLYNKWLADCMKHIEGNKEKAIDILNDCIVNLYDRIAKKGGEIEIDNIGGYISTAFYFSKISTSSPYQRKRGMQYKYVSIDDVYEIQ